VRIGVIAPPWLPVPPPAYGGIEAVVDSLGRSLAARGHEVVLAAHPQSTCPVRMALPDAPALDVPIGGIGTELRHATESYLALERADVDLIHDHTLAGPFVARSVTSRPVITTCHSVLDRDLLPVYRLLSRHLSVVAISETQRSATTGLRFAATIHHGIDAAPVEPGEGRGGYLLFLGRMAPEKGVDIAVRMAQRARWPLLIAAKMREPAELEFFRTAVQPLLGPDVVHVGEVGGTEKLALLRGAAALLNPIRWSEPFGMVMIEALAAGTPVVTFPLGAATEIVEDGVSGYLCRDEDEMVHRLGQLGRLDRAACRRRVVARFSVEQMAQQHERLYRSVLTASRRSTGSPSTVVPVVPVVPSAQEARP
jgi:glycosyltransferase involved in cell wall biosynthesis